MPLWREETTLPVTLKEVFQGQWKGLIQRGLQIRRVRSGLAHTSLDTTKSGKSKTRDMISSNCPERQTPALVCSTILRPVFQFGQFVIRQLTNLPGKQFLGSILEKMKQRENYKEFIYTIPRETSSKCFKSKIIPLTMDLKQKRNQNFSEFWIIFKFLKVPPTIRKKDIKKEKIIL